MLRVGMQFVTLCVTNLQSDDTARINETQALVGLHLVQPEAGVSALACDAERHERHSHAEREEREVSGRTLLVTMCLAWK